MRTREYSLWVCICVCVCVVASRLFCIKWISKCIWFFLFCVESEWSSNFLMLCLMIKTKSISLEKHKTLLQGIEITTTTAELSTQIVYAFMPNWICDTYTLWLSLSLTLSVSLIHFRRNTDKVNVIYRKYQQIQDNTHIHTHAPKQQQQQLLSISYFLKDANHMLFVIFQIVK